MEQPEELLDLLCGRRRLGGFQSLLQVIDGTEHQINLKQNEI